MSRPRKATHLTTYLVSYLAFCYASQSGLFVLAVMPPHTLTRTHTCTHTRTSHAGLASKQVPASISTAPSKATARRWWLELACLMGRSGKSLGRLFPWFPLPTAPTNCLALLPFGRPDHAEALGYSVIIAWRGSVRLINTALYPSYYSTSWLMQQTKTLRMDHTVLSHSHPAIPAFHALPDHPPSCLLPSFSPSVAGRYRLPPTRTD